MGVQKYLPASSFKFKHLSYARKCNFGPVIIKPVHYLHWAKSESRKGDSPQYPDDDGNEAAVIKTLTS